jgi:predicted O-methyltransferase YrrM
VTTIPTAVTPCEAAELQRLARGGDVLEVGSLLGFSTVTLARVARHVHSVDPHAGYPAHDPRPTLEPFLRNLREHGVRDKVTVHVGTDGEVLPALAPAQFDMAFLDMTGLYNDTYYGIERAARVLRHQAVLCVHDCGHPDWPGALAAVEDYATHHGTEFRLVDRMAIFEQTWH